MYRIYAKYDIYDNVYTRIYAYDNVYTRIYAYIRFGPNATTPDEKRQSKENWLFPCKQRRIEFFRWIPLLQNLNLTRQAELRCWFSQKKISHFMINSHRIRIHDDARDSYEDDAKEEESRDKMRYRGT
jgi:hypothetical protein